MKHHVSGELVHCIAFIIYYKNNVKYTCCCNFMLLDKSLGALHVACYCGSYLDLTWCGMHEHE
jgi:hypothetical protein